MPPIPGLDEARPWTNREATTAKAAPESLVILGGGVVGVELAQAWSSLGTRVTVVEGARALIVARGAVRVRAGRRRRCARLGVDVRTGQQGGRASRGRRRRCDGRARRRHERARRRAARRGRPRGRRRTGWARDRRARAGKPVEVGDEPALAAARLALRDRRRQRPRAAHAHGQVPGAARGGRDPRQGRAPRLGRAALAARDLHRPAGGGRRAHACVRRAGGAATCAPSTSRPAATAGASFVGRNTPGTSRLVVDEERGVIVGATFTGFEIGGVAARARRSRSSARCRSSGSSTPCRAFPPAASSG